MVESFKKENQATVENLIRLAIDVYNDSKLLTPSAWSWPSRSLASLCAEKQIKTFNDNGSDTSFSEYQPLPIDLHYRDPVVYAEMLSIIADLEIAKHKDKLNNVIRFSCQIDGSVDSMQNDNKIVFIRFNTPADPIEVKTQLVSVCSSELRGSAGLEDVFVRSMQKIGFDESIIREKFAGMKTDKESANTGRNTGLWPRLENWQGENY